MKLIDLTCNKCGAQLKVNADLKKCMCQYCGNEMLIDDEVKHHKLDNGFDFGYQAEMGRLKAQAEYQEQKIIEENIVKQQNLTMEAKQYINAKITLIISCITFVIIGCIYDSDVFGGVLVLLTIISIFYDMAYTLGKASLFTLLWIFVLPFIGVPYLMLKTSGIFRSIIYGSCIGYIIGLFIGM